MLTKPAFLEFLDLRFIFVFVSLLKELVKLLFVNFKAYFLTSVFIWRVSSDYFEVDGRVEVLFLRESDLKIIHFDFVVDLVFTLYSAFRK